MKKKISGFSRRAGFSLIEIMIYIAIFAVSAVFLTSILTVITRVQLKQASTHELEQQISFVGDAVQRYVQKSNLIDIDPGTATSTLRLRMAASSTDVTLIYASGTVLYLDERDVNGDAQITALTDSKVSVDSFYVTKYENPGGFAVAELNLVMSYNTDNPQADATRTLQTAITRISAAEFDSDVNPNTDNALNLGAVGKNWRNAYFSGTLQVGSNIKLVGSTGNLATIGAGNGLIMKTPNGSACYLVSVTNSGTVTSTATSCP
jgi:prepilin-type N-terminal cleavage/methylation domain-containing protein